MLCSTGYTDPVLPHPPSLAALTLDACQGGLLPACARLSKSEDTSGDDYEM